MRVFASTRRGHGAILVLVALAGLGIGCKKGGGDAVDWKSGFTGGQLVFEDDFARAELGPSWKAEGPSWRLVDGWAHDDRAENAGLWLNTPLPERARIEFKTRSEFPEGNRPFAGDTKCEVFCSEQKHQTGYILIFGGWQNTINTVARLDEHGKDRLEETQRRVIAGKTYTWTIVRTDDTLRWYLDGQPFLRYKDPNPLKGKYFGFNNWQANVFFDDVKVWAL